MYIHVHIKKHYFTSFKTFTPSWIGWGNPANEERSFFTWKPTNFILVESRNCSKSFCLFKVKTNTLNFHALQQKKFRKEMKMLDSKLHVAVFPCVWCCHHYDFFPEMIKMFDIKLNVVVWFFQEIMEFSDSKLCTNVSDCYRNGLFILTWLWVSRVVFFGVRLWGWRVGEGWGACHRHCSAARFRPHR